MFIRMSPLRWAVMLFVSACAAPGLAPVPEDEVEVSHEELVANPCAFTLCPVGTRCEPNPKQPGEAVCLPTPDLCAVVRCRAGTHCSDGQCIPDEPKVFCGGFGGFACPGHGKCIDDPADDCAPPEGADCAGMCICKPRGLCKPGMHWESSPTVCACVPDSDEKVFCGGIAGIPCPGAGKCIDDLSDDCAPPEGADCGGICICRPRSPCAKGTHWSADPEVCACVPDGGAACGGNVCAPGEYCCNASCGMCAPPGRLCIQIACN